jgi:hypothetical protein
MSPGLINLYALVDVTKPYKFIGFRGHVWHQTLSIYRLWWMSPNPYQFICFVAMDDTRPYKLIRFGAMDVTRPSKFICFGGCHQTL